MVGNRKIGVLFGGLSGEREISVRTGEAIRIMPGAPMPDHADAVVMVERTRRDGDDGVLVEQAAPPGEILVGGQQDRTLADELIVPPKTKQMPLDVFCVEHGRWTGSSPSRLRLTSTHSSITE